MILQEEFSHSQAEPSTSGAIEDAPEYAETFEQAEQLREKIRVAEIELQKFKSQLEILENPSGNSTVTSEPASSDTQLLTNSPQVAGPLGTLSKLPPELRRMVFRYVLTLGGSAEDYVKGQEKDTDGRAVRTGLLRTSKALHEEAMDVVFNENRFILCGSYWETRFETGWGLRFFINKAEPYDPDNFNVAKPHQVVRTCDANLIDLNKVPDHLLSRIQYLAVQFSEDGDPDDHSNCFGDHNRRWIRERDPFYREESWKPVQSRMVDILRRCTVLSYLHLVVRIQHDSYEDVEMDDFPTEDFLALIEDLSTNVRAVRKLDLYCFFDHCGQDVYASPGANDDEYRNYILSAKYQRHVERCMHMPKGKDTPEFEGGNRLRDITDCRGPPPPDSTNGLGGYEYGLESLWYESWRIASADPYPARRLCVDRIDEDGDERLELIGSGWVWEGGYTWTGAVEKERRRLRKEEEEESRKFLELEASGTADNESDETADESGGGNQEANT